MTTIFTKINDNKKGITAGAFSGITWGLDTVLVSIVLVSAPFTKSENAMFLAPFISVFLHDLFSTLWMLIYMIFKRDVKNVINVATTRSGIFIALAALLGGPIGMTSYILAVKYIGPTYTATISSLYPAVGALFAFIFLKERLSPKGWFGLFLSILGIATLSYLPLDDSHVHHMLGFIFSFSCVLGWSLESVVCGYGMKNEEITPEQALLIRQFVSVITYSVVVIPAINGLYLLTEVIFTKTSLILLFTALTATTSYVLWYYSIHKIGSTKGTILNITYTVWAIIFQIIFLGNSVSLKLIICCVIIILGSILALTK